MKPAETLKLFNEKVDLLDGLSFARALREQQSGTVAEFRQGKGWEAIFVGPTDEQFYAFILTIRLFKQTGDGISLQQLRKLYAKHIEPSDPSLAHQQYELHDRLNDALDQPTNLGVTANANLAYREILDAWTYGVAAHTNPKHRQLVEDLATTPLYPFFQALLVAALGRFTEALRVTRFLNRKAIEILDVGAGVLVDDGLGQRGGHKL